MCRFIHHHDDDGGGTVCIFLLATIERRAKLVEEDSGRYQTVTGTTANGKERRAKLMKASLRSLPLARLLLFLPKNNASNYTPTLNIPPTNRAYYCLHCISFDLISIVRLRKAINHFKKSSLSIMSAPASWRHIGLHGHSVGTFTSELQYFIFIFTYCIFA